MPGVQFYFSLSDANQSDRRLERVEVWCPNTSQRIGLLRLLIVGRLRDILIEPERRRCLAIDSVRLFFNGQELQDEYKISDYDIVEGNLIQVMIKQDGQQEDRQKLDDPNASTKMTTEDGGIEKNVCDETSMTEDCFYSVGDNVDAFDSDSGAWFPARITVIKRRSTNEDETYYCVTYGKPSLGFDVPLKREFVRPPAHNLITEPEQLEPGMLVMASVTDGQWYVGGVESIRESKKGRSVIVTVNLVTRAQEMPLVRHQIKFNKHNQIFKLERNVRMDQRTPELDQVIKLGPTIKRYIKPDCNQCKDDGSVSVCLECGCQVCHGKEQPERQMVCDECNRSTHFGCLRQPINKIPEEEHWYCDLCRNESSDDIDRLRRLHLDGKTDRSEQKQSWGFGMACVGRSTSFINASRALSKAFGPIAGVRVGTWWRFRVQASECGVHAPLVSSIHGKESEGAYSLVFAGLDPNDADLGDDIYYTGFLGVSHKPKNRGTLKHCQDQSLKRELKALAVSCHAELNELKGNSAENDWQLGKPLRVLRSGNNRQSKKNSLYLPKIGVRYDGIYKVVKYWSELSMTSGHRVWRFHLRRDDPEPAPWTEPGRYQARKHGLDLCYPPGWCQAVAQKRLWKQDKKIRAKQQRKRQKQSTKVSNRRVARKHGQTKHVEAETEAESTKVLEDFFKIPEAIRNLIELDEANQTIWKDVLTKKMTKQELDDYLRETFRCVCCLDLVQDPVTTECGHNFCAECFHQTILMDQKQQAETSVRKSVERCPMCRRPLKKPKIKKLPRLKLKGRKNVRRTTAQSTSNTTTVIKTNVILEQVLKKLLES